MPSAQRALAAAEARKRKAATQFKPAMHPVGEDFPPPDALANSKARDKVADLFGVSGKTVDMAERVIKKGVAPLVEAVSGPRASVEVR